MSEKWYVLQVYSGREKKVKKSIDENVLKANLKSDIEEVYVPVENIVEVKAGQKVIKEKILWPGYVLVKMNLTDDVWHFIKDENNVLGFLGGGAPAPLSDREVDELVRNLSGDDGEIVHKYNIDCGDVVKITDGVFVNLTGTVSEIFQDKGKLSVLVSIFGRDTKVDDLEMWQVEKITND
ncbi:MAG: Transcription termination/antitermination protein NusG [Chlamydiia bacterium]|nr:Transcription termination/antitermination protein NusG [Chlamydiia bacterium]